MPDTAVRVQVLPIGSIAAVVSGVKIASRAKPDRTCRVELGNNFSRTISEPGGAHADSQLARGDAAC